MRTRTLCTFILMLLTLTLVTHPTVAQEPDLSINVALARNYFNEAEALCRQEQGQLWGVSLCGPMLFVDAETRTVVASQRDGKGLLIQKDGVFVGTWPIEMNISNTAIEWSGAKWTMIAWPLPEDRQDRARLMMHELYHRIQDDLGRPGSNPSNSHLDSRDGRIWLQMEWRALERALIERGLERRQAIRDAYIFRAYRHSLFREAAKEETALEINEGLAEYTGFKLSSRSEAEFALRSGCTLRQARFRPTFVRSFAYLSGPAYGALLDESRTNWRRGLRANDDLGSMLVKAYAIKAPGVSAQLALKQASDYSGEILIADETARDEAKQELMKTYRERFLKKPVLIVPLTPKMQYSFNPNNLIPFDENSTVYPTLRVSDEWGILEVTDGALMIRESGRMTRVLIGLPNNLLDRPLKGTGWKLQLNQGWGIEPADLKDSFLLKRKPA